MFPAPDRPLRLPHVTPEWVAELEWWAGVRGLPFDPWPLPVTGPAAAVFPSAAARNPRRSAP